MFKIEIELNVKIHPESLTILQALLSGSAAPVASTEKPVGEKKAGKSMPLPGAKKATTSVEEPETTEDEVNIDDVELSLDDARAAVDEARDSAKAKGKSRIKGIRATLDSYGAVGGGVSLLEKEQYAAFIKDIQALPFDQK